MKHLQEKGYLLLDCQQTTDHLLSMGAREVTRQKFLQYLQEAELPPHGPLISHF